MEFLKGLNTGLEKTSFHYEMPACSHRVEHLVFDYLMEFNQSFAREVVFLCIGTDRATGDCLGPLVGTRLQTYHSSASVVGTLADPTHAVNLVEVLQEIHRRFKNPLLVAVDASLGNSDRVGFINVKKGGLKPGTALKKSLPEVGDFHVSGVVNIGGFLDQMVLQNTRLNIVYRMAEIIARALYMANLKFENEKRHQLLESGQA